MIKTILLGAVSAIVISGAAQAQSSRAYVPVPVMTWDGFYAGVNAGYINGRRENTFGLNTNQGTGGGTAAANVANAEAATGRGTDLSAILGGGGIGYNWQFGTIVAGVDADIQTSSSSRELRGPVVVPIAGFPTNPVTGVITTDQRFNYFGTVRARLGYTLFDNMLVYATGGLAYGEKLGTQHFDFAVNNATFITYTGTSSRVSKTEVGYTVGGGIEYRLDANWSVKAEALYYDLGKTRSVSTFDSNGLSGLFTRTIANRSIDNSGVIGRVGVNYKFSWF